MVDIWDVTAFPAFQVLHAIENEIIGELFIGNPEQELTHLDPELSCNTNNGK